MNTQEKYLAGYVTEALTGIKGENQEWVYQVIEKGDFRMSDPFLQLVYDIAKTDPSRKEVKDTVAGLVIGYTLLNNKMLSEAMNKTIDALVAKKMKGNEVHEDKPDYKNITMSYDIEDGELFAVLWYKDQIVGNIRANESKKDTIIEKFKNRFPSAKLVEVK